MSTNQIILLSVLVVVSVLLVFMTIKVWGKPRPTASATPVGTSPATTPTPTPVTSTTPVRTTSVTSSTTRGSSWFGNSMGFVGWFLKLVIVLFVIVAILYGVVCGGMWLKGKMDGWAPQCGNNTSGIREELVVISPGSSQTVTVGNLGKAEFDAPFPTMVEFLDGNGQRIPVLCNNKPVWFVIVSPTLQPDLWELEDQPVGALIFSSVSRNIGEYSFVFRTK